MSGCGKHDKHDKHDRDCVCETVRAIKEAQDAVDRHEDDCDNNCFDLLGNEECGCHKKRHRHDTIPFFLQNDQGIPFFTATVRQRNSGCEVVITPFFRVSKIKDCCATLELLDTGIDIPFPPQGNSMAMFAALQNDTRCLDLRRTGKCITVDLTCFCAIQCLDPAFVTS